MKQSSKKIIARELLILLISTVIFFIIAFVWNYIASQKEEKYSAQLQNIEIELSNKRNIDSLPYRLKICTLLIQNWEGYNGKEDILLAKLKSNKGLDKVYNALKFNNLITISFQEFKSELNRDNKSENYYSQLERIEHKIITIKDEKNFYSRTDENIELFGLLLIILVYPLRLLVYVTMWSIKTVRS